jgi:hypothetical protein
MTRFDEGGRKAFFFGAKASLRKVWRVLIELMDSISARHVLHTLVRYLNDHTL